MAIPNTVQDRRSYVVGMTSKTGPQRVSAFSLDYVWTNELQACPSYAMTLNDDGRTIRPGGTGPFVGILKGNQRIFAPGEYFKPGEVVEVAQMDFVAVDLHGNTSAIAYGKPIHFEVATGRLGLGVGNGSDTVTIDGAIVEEFGDDKDPRLATISLTGPLPKAVGGGGGGGPVDADEVSFMPGDTGMDSNTAGAAIREVVQFVMGRVGAEGMIFPIVLESNGPLEVEIKFPDFDCEVLKVEQYIHTPKDNDGAVEIYTGSNKTGDKIGEMDADEDDDDMFVPFNSGNLWQVASNTTWYLSKSDAVIGGAILVTVRKAD